MLPKISVIIPVYNSEKYLEKCLDSVINQTFKELEIILINDYSSDNSLSVLEKYQKKDNRIKLINLPENKGPAHARNLGIKEAKGEYLSFIDSDDYIELNFYENLYKKAQSSDADIIKGSDIKIIHPDGNIETDEQNYKIKRNKLYFFSQYTSAIFKRDFIIKNNIDFPTGLILGDDPVFTMKSAILANKIDIANNAQYYYVRHEGSLNTFIWDDERINSYIKYSDLISEFAQKQNLSKDNSCVFFGRLLDNIEKTKNVMTRNRKKAVIFDDLFKRVRARAFKYPIKLLFEIEQFVWANKYLGARRGIYWVCYNLLKQFASDKRFEVTLWLNGNYDIQGLKDDPVIKNLPIVYNTFTNKKVPNKNFIAHEYDVFFNPAIYKTITAGKVPQIVNVLYDTLPMLDTKWYPANGSLTFFEFYRRLNKDTVGFCISQSTKKDFSRFFYNLDPEKMYVFPISTSVDIVADYDKEKLNKTLDKYNVPKDKRQKYIFYLGSVDDYRKNTLFNIECFIKFINKYNIKDLYFYLGGHGSKNLDNILKSRLGELYTKNKDYIVFLSYLNDNDVNILYSNSLFFSFLSEYEGFGIPPLEAMKAGVPVVCANNSSLPEVVGDSAILVDTYNEDEVIEAFRTFYFDENKRKEYIKKGLERGRKFSWENTYNLYADKIIAILKGDEL